MRDVEGNQWDGGGEEGDVVGGGGGQKDEVVDCSGKEEDVALGGVGALALAEIPEVWGDLGEEAGVGVFKLAEAFTGDGAGVAVDAVIGAVGDGEEELNEAL